MAGISRYLCTYTSFQQTCGVRLPCLATEHMGPLSVSPVPLAGVLGTHGLRIPATAGEQHVGTILVVCCALPCHTLYQFVHVLPRV